MISDATNVINWLLKWDYFLFATKHLHLITKMTFQKNRWIMSWKDERMNKSLHQAVKDTAVEQIYIFYANVNINDFL